MYCIGMVGHIGSGKSTAVALFQDLGVPCIQADEINKQLLKTGTATYQRIVTHFGDAVLLADKTIDKAFLRKKITEDKAAQKALEAILHPEIEQAIIHHIKQIKDSPYCIVEIPILTERPTYLQRILWIQAPPLQQIERIVKRDHCAAKAVEKMINIQPDFEIYKMIADDIVQNDTSLSMFAKKIKTLHHQYLKISQSFS